MEDEFKDVLSEEKARIREYLLSSNIAEFLGYGRQKNVKDSTEYRKRGNALYTSKVHTESSYEEAWKLYSQSIALAPNNSEELALGFGNRSALWFHLTKYKECIKDCDRALAISKCKFLTSKLLVRKAECLAKLNKNSAQNVYEEALHRISELQLKCDLKKQYEDRLHNVLNDIKITKLKKQARGKKNDQHLYEFKRSKEVPCASEAIAINYNKKWDRHIIATRDIEIGEIIVIEKSYFKCLTPDGIYFYCLNCLKPAYASIPCNHCIYGVYCSEKCRSEAWTEFHQFECPILSHISDIEKYHSSCAIRLALKTIHEIGGIYELQKMLQDIEQCKDPRTKGFSTDGIYHTDKAKSCFSLQNCFNYTSLSHNIILINRICSDLKLLATKSTFFGKKMSFSKDSEMAFNNDIVFVGALFIRIFHTMRHNCFAMLEGNEPFNEGHALCFSGFLSLFNHSCDPNTRLIFAKDNYTILFATKPIKQKSQLFVSYISNFLKTSKKERCKLFKENFHFECKCIPCLENWSNISVPTLQDIITVTPSIFPEIQNFFNNCPKIQNVTLKNIKYSPEVLQQVINAMKILADKITVHCYEYQLLECMLEIVYTQYFGSWFIEMKKGCYSYKDESESEDSDL